jgi:hypothetical protein
VSSGAAMRRREPVVDLGVSPAPELLRFRYADWADESEPVPIHARDWAWPEWWHIRALRRWMDARRQWCTETGRDYAETFHPEWNRWRG